MMFGIKYLGVVFHENFEYYRHIDFMLSKVKKVFFSYCNLLRGRGGLSNEIRLLVYRQIIRPLMSYAFPVWFSVSSHQMQRLRIWERRILSGCLGLTPRMLLDGTFRRSSCRLLYERYNFERIDVFLMRTAITFLEQSSVLLNEMVSNCFSHASDLDGIRGHRYLSPIDLLTLRDAGLLYREDRLLFYHRRVNTLDIQDLVYNTAQ